MVWRVQERIAKAPKLKMAITAGIGSDHVDLQVRSCCVFKHCAV